MSPKDDVNIGTALNLRNRKSDPPMACCPRDGEPLISTLEFAGAEFYCVVCRTKYGFLSPSPKDWTQELQDRHDVLREQYDTERAERREQRGSR